MSYSVACNCCGVNSSVYALNNRNIDINPSTCCINKETMEEDVVKKKGHIFNDFIDTFKGSINGKAVKLNSKSQGITVFDDTNVSGTIDGKEFNVVKKGAKSIFSVDRSFQGQYNGRSFDLKIERSGFLNSKASIVGIIDGQEVKFDLNGGEVPIDDEVQDILSTILMLNGQEAKQKDGVFKGIKSSDWKMEEDLQQAMMMSTTI